LLLAFDFLLHFCPRYPAANSHSNPWIFFPDYKIMFTLETRRSSAMTPDTKFLLDETAKLFAKKSAKWDQRSADRDAKWD
jgi:hypothetical protein